ncbi:hypothetical protein BJX99DRAFT_242839 [Aspergillus californicus]
MDRSWFAIMLASITAAVLVFPENPAAHSTPPCSAPTGLEPGGAVVVLASYKAYDSTPLAKSSMSAHRAISSGTVTSSHSAGASSGRNGLRNTTHPLTSSVTASTRVKSSAAISPTSPFFGSFGSGARVDPGDLLWHLRSRGSVGMVIQLTPLTLLLS